MSDLTEYSNTRLELLKAAIFAYWDLSDYYYSHQEQTFLMDVEIAIAKDLRDQVRSILEQTRYQTSLSSEHYQKIAYATDYFRERLENWQINAKPLAQ